MDSPFFEMWKLIRWISPVPMCKVDLFDDEIVGEKEPRRLADTLYNGINPSEFLPKGHDEPISASATPKWKS